jgi:hypothetical protein
VRRPLATLFLALALVLAAPAVPAVAADDPATTSTTTAPRAGGDIIPMPNSGVEPEDPGDRGGALQTALFLGLIGIMIGVGAALVVQSRKARADRGF